MQENVIDKRSYWMNIIITRQRIEVTAKSWCSRWPRLRMYRDLCKKRVVGDVIIILSFSVFVRRASDIVGMTQLPLHHLQLCIVSLQLHYLIISIYVHIECTITINKIMYPVILQIDLLYFAYYHAVCDDYPKYAAKTTERRTTQACFVSSFNRSWFAGMDKKMLKLCCSPLAKETLWL